MTRFVSGCALLSILVFLCFTASSALARDSARELCHRHCAGEYDKFVTARENALKHEKNTEKKQQEIEDLQKKNSETDRKRKQKQAECDRLHDKKFNMPNTPANSKALADAHIAWSNCEREITNLYHDMAKRDQQIMEAQNSLEYMKAKQKKLDEATQVAEDAYDDCMEKCMKDPKIQEKIPDSVIGDLEPLNKIPRKSSNPDDRTVKPGSKKSGDKTIKNEREKLELDDGLPLPKSFSGGKKANPDDGLPPPAKREVRPEPPPAKCPECQAIREKDVKDARKDLDDIEKTTNEIEDAHYKLLAEQSLKHQMLQDAKEEMKGLSQRDVKKRQDTQGYIGRLQKDLDGLKKEVADSRKRLDGWKADLKKAEKAYERALLDFNKCNEKSCPKQASQATPEERKSLIKSILGGVSIGVGVGGGSDHGGHGEHHDSHEIEWEHE